MSLRDFYKSFISKGVEKKGVLDKELLYNLYKVPVKDKGVNKPHQTNDVENGVHQMDLLELPDDKDRKYALVVVDLATRKTDAEPLESKSSNAVLEALKAIYARKTLSLPTVMEVDPGSEFKSVVAKYLHDNKVLIRVGKKARHRQQATVESRNQIIGKAIHMSQVAKELLTKKPQREWVRTLPSIIKKVNEFLTQRVDKKKEAGIPLVSGTSANILQEGDKVRVKLEQPEDVATGKRLHGNFRKSDIRWERQPRTVEQVLFQPDQPIMYKISGIPHVAYTKNQLQVVPKGERLPPKSVLNR